MGKIKFTAIFLCLFSLTLTGASCGNTEKTDLSGGVSVDSQTYTQPNIDERTHKLQGSGTINISISGNTVRGNLEISANDYWQCPLSAENENDYCVSSSGEHYPGQSWLPGVPVNISGPISGTFENGQINAEAGGYQLTGNFSDGAASGDIHYNFPNGQPAFHWSATAGK
jgi:hypothetical protein